MANVISVDIGYGGVKMVRGVSEKGKPQLHYFSSSVALGAPVMSSDVKPRDTFISLIDGMRYEAGNESHLAMQHNTGRFESTGYSATPQYMALVNAALGYTELKVVDLLVLGLPNSTFGVEKEALERSMVGEHVFTRYTSNHEEVTHKVTVKNVIVLRQPYGGLVDALSTDDKRFEEMQEDDVTSLIIDPGYFTLDFIVSSGEQVNAQRSGAVNRAGASAIYRAIQTKLQTETGWDVDLSRIEDAFAKERDKIRVNGQAYGIESFKNEIDGSVQQAMLNLRAKVQSFEDLDHIVIVGGAARLYKPVVEQLTGRKDIIISSDPKFANVRGFQIIGEQYAEEALA